MKNRRLKFLTIILIALASIVLSLAGAVIAAPQDPTTNPGPNQGVLLIQAPIERSRSS